MAFHDTGGVFMVVGQDKTCLFIFLTDAQYAVLLNLILKPKKANNQAYKWEVYVLALSERQAADKVTLEPDYGLLVSKRKPVTVEPAPHPFIH